MAGIVYMRSNTAVSLTGSEYTAVTPKSKTLYLQTGTASTDRLKYGLTTDTTASIYSPTINIPKYIYGQYWHKVYNDSVGVSGTAMVVYHDKIHVIIYGTPSAAKHYILEGSTLTSLNDIPYGFNPSSGNVVVFNDKIYLLAGSNYRNDYSQYFYYWNENTDSWVNAGAINWKFDNCVAIVGNQPGYPNKECIHLLGDAENTGREHHLYTLDQGFATMGTYLPISIYNSNASSVIYDNKLYIFYGNYAYYKELNNGYDPNWVTEYSTSRSIKYSSAISYIDDNIYVFGCEDFDYRNQFLKGTPGNWIPLLSDWYLPSDFISDNNQNAIVYKDKIYIFIPYDGIYVFDGIWNTINKNYYIARKETAQSTASLSGVNANITNYIHAESMQYLAYKDEYISIYSNVYSTRSYSGFSVTVSDSYSNAIGWVPGIGFNPRFAIYSGSNGVTGSVGASHALQFLPSMTTASNNNFDKYSYNKAYAQSDVGFLDEMLFPTGGVFEDNTKYATVSTISRHYAWKRIRLSYDLFTDNVTMYTTFETVSRNSNYTSGVSYSLSESQGTKGYSLSLEKSYRSTYSTQWTSGVLNNASSYSHSGNVANIPYSDHTVNYTTDIYHVIPFWGSKYDRIVPMTKTAITYDFTNAFFMATGSASNNTTYTRSANHYMRTTYETTYSGSSKITFQKTTYTKNSLNNDIYFSYPGTLTITLNRVTRSSYTYLHSHFTAMYTRPYRVSGTGNKSAITSYTTNRMTRSSQYTYDRESHRRTSTGLYTRTQPSLYNITYTYPVISDNCNA